jgi:hypothetical protein
MNFGTRTSTRMYVPERHQRPIYPLLSVPCTRSNQNLIAECRTICDETCSGFRRIGFYSGGAVVAGFPLSARQRTAQ